MWRLILVLLSAYSLNSSKAEHSSNVEGVPDYEEFADGLMKRYEDFLEVPRGVRNKRDTILTVDSQIANSRSVDSEDEVIDDIWPPWYIRSKGDSIFTVASQVANSRSVEEMIKRIDAFSRKFPTEVLKEKSLTPFVGKFRGELKKLSIRAKPVLEMARKLEKSGAKKSKKQLAQFKLKMTQLQKHIQSFTTSVKAESKKQRNNSLKMMKSNPNDLKVLEDAKRCISMGNVISDTLQLIQSLPGKIYCFISGNCEDNSEGDSGGGDDDTDNSDGDGEEDETEQNNADLLPE